MKKLLSLLVLPVFVLLCLTPAGCLKSPADLLKDGGKEPAGRQEQTPGGTQRAADEPSVTPDASGGTPGSLEGLTARGRDAMMRQGVACDYVMSGPGGTMTMKMWFQGYRFKTEGTFSGQKMISIVDLQEKTVITYYPDQNKAVKLSADAPEVKAKPPSDYLETPDFGRAQVLETVVYDGARCKVVLLPEAGGGPTKMWIREDCGIPVRVETTAADGARTVIEYKNLRIGVPPGTFELPLGVEVTDLNRLLDQLPKMPGSPQ